MDIPYFSALPQRHVRISLSQELAAVLCLLSIPLTLSF